MLGQAASDSAHVCQSGKQDRSGEPHHTIAQHAQRQPTDEAGPLDRHNITYKTRTLHWVCIAHAFARDRDAMSTEMFERACTAPSTT
eukprot:95174-Alexandrium_andersonii.AAC.1